MFSVFHRIEIVVVSDTPRDRWCSAFGLGEFVGIELIQIYDYKVLTLILSPETLPCKVTFIGSRDWLGPGIFEGHRFHLHLTVHICPVYIVHLSCSSIL